MDDDGFLNNISRRLQGQEQAEQRKDLHSTKTREALRAVAALCRTMYLAMRAEGWRRLEALTVIGIYLHQFVVFGSEQNAEDDDDADEEEEP